MVQIMIHDYHQGVLAAKVSDFGSNLLKCPTWADGHQTC